MRLVFSLVLVFVFAGSAVAEDDSGQSLYQTSARWTTQSNSQMELKELKGKLVVLAMAYTSCPYSCPLTIALMKKIEARVPKSERGKVQYVLVSLDPDHDTPEAMDKFAKKSGFDPSHWTLLTGASDDVRELAVLLGIKYQNTTSGEINHTTLVALLDREGKVVARQEGLGGDGDALSRALLRSF